SRSARRASGRIPCRAWVISGSTRDCPDTVRAINEIAVRRKSSFVGSWQCMRWDSISGNRVQASGSKAAEQLHPITSQAGERLLYCDRIDGDNTGLLRLDLLRQNEWATVLFAEGNCH